MRRLFPSPFFIYIRLEIVQDAGPGRLEVAASEFYVGRIGIVEAKSVIRVSRTF